MQKFVVLNRMSVASESCVSLGLTAALFRVRLDPKSTLNVKVQRVEIFPLTGKDFGWGFRIVLLDFSASQNHLVQVSFNVCVLMKKINK